MTKKTVFAYIRMHTAKNTQKKAYFVGYHRPGEAYQALRYDGWWPAFRRWWQLRRLGYKRVRLYRA